jgi:hypothetical protein
MSERRAWPESWNVELIALERKRDEATKREREYHNLWHDERERAERAEAALRDAATVIERMANGASRKDCSPELDRVIAALARREARDE